MTIASRNRAGILASAVLFSLPWVGQSGVLPDSDYAALARVAIDQVIVPAYVEHARAMRGLGLAIDRHCMGGAAADDDAVRETFAEAMDAWQRVWPFGIGPVMREGRARIAFWPGRPGSAARQMRKVLRTRDEVLLDPRNLVGKSVAIKDLQALERLLFGVPRDACTCGLAGAIGRYQSSLAQDILNEWTKEGGFRQAALAAGGDSDGYADHAEVARDLMRVLSESLARCFAAVELEDICGIAQGDGAGVFIAAGAGGQVGRIDARAGESTLLARTDGSHGDNHLVALGTLA